MALNVNKIVNNLSKKIVKKVTKNIGEIKRESKVAIQDSFLDFPRPPIDTGLSQDNSFAQSQVNKNGFDLTLGIATDYSIYFRDPQSPKNPNYKYGKRDPIKKAIPKIKDIIKKNLS